MIVAAIDTLCEPVTDTVFEEVLVDDDEGLSVNVAIDDSDGEELTDTDELVEGEPDGESLVDDDPDDTRLTVLHSEIDDDAVLVFIIYVSVVEVVAELVVLEDIVIVLDTNAEELTVGDDDCVFDGLGVPETVPDLRGVSVIGGLLETDILTVDVFDCDTEDESVPELLIVFDTDILRVPVAQLDAVFVTAWLFVAVTDALLEALALLVNELTGVPVTLIDIDGVNVPSGVDVSVVDTEGEIVNVRDPTAERVTLVDVERVLDVLTDRVVVGEPLDVVDSFADALEDLCEVGVFDACKDLEDVAVVLILGDEVVEALTLLLDALVTECVAEDVLVLVVVGDFV